MAGEENSNNPIISYLLSIERRLGRLEGEMKVVQKIIFAVLSGIIAILGGIIALLFK